MSARRVRLPWTQQPQGAVAVDAQHRSADSLLFLFDGSAAADAANPAAPAQRGGNVVLSPGADGVGFLANDSGYLVFPSPRKHNATEMTILLVFAYTRNTNYDAVKFYTGRAWTTDYLGTECYYYGGNIVAGATGADNLNLGASAGVGATNVAWLTWNGTSVRACANGRDDVTGSRSVFNINNDPQSVVIGCNVNTGLGITRGSRLYMAAIWNRALARAERDNIGANPWALFAPRQIVIPSAAPPGYTHPTLSSARMIWTGPGAGKPAIDYSW